MKNKIKFFIFAVILYFLIKQIFDTWIFCINGSIISSIIQSIVFAVTVLFMTNIQTKRMQKKISKIDNYLGQKVISCGWMNHLGGIIADGGIGYLLPDDSLVFVPNKLNLSHKALTMKLSDIERISDYRVRGLFDTGLKIELKSGKVEKFVVDKSASFYEELKNRHCQETLSVI